jgi:hypothetical protein
LYVTCSKGRIHPNINAYKQTGVLISIFLKKNYNGEMNVKKGRSILIMDEELFDRLETIANKWSKRDRRIWYVAQVIVKILKDHIESIDE